MVRPKQYTKYDLPDVAKVCRLSIAEIRDDHSLIGGDLLSLCCFLGRNFKPATQKKMKEVLILCPDIKKAVEATDFPLNVDVLTGEPPAPNGLQWIVSTESIDEQLGINSVRWYTELSRERVDPRSILSFWLFAAFVARADYRAEIHVALFRETG